jgi:uncharacterized protein YecE (DUF72 family)
MDSSRQAAVCQALPAARGPGYHGTVSPLDRVVARVYPARDRLINRWGREVTELNLAIPARYEGCLRVGACSWKFDSWKGLVYRPGVEYGPNDYLPDYARHFNTVEVDQWFWSLFPPGVKLPDEATVKAYADSVPDDFLFTVKAPNSITLTNYYAKQPKRYLGHANRPNEHFLSPDLLRRFLDALAPMDDKLGPIMFQFEYLNKAKMPSKEAFFDRLHEFLEAAPSGYRYAVESRNPNYLSPGFFDFLREHGLGYVFLDGYYMPPIGEVFAGHDTFTADFTVIRLHGGDRPGIEARTGKNWHQVVEPKPAGVEAAVRITLENLRRRIRMVVNVNNHYEGSAPLTIERFLALLDKEDDNDES